MSNLNETKKADAASSVLQPANSEVKAADAKLKGTQDEILIATVDDKVKKIGRDELVALGRPVVIGTSRKSFLGRLTGREVDDRVAGTIATNVLAYERGARVFRVHDVAPVRDALAVAAATVSAPWTTPTSTTR